MWNKQLLIDMKKYFNGHELYGDNLSQEQIKQWFKEEKEGYSSIVSKELELLSKGIYLYNNINVFHRYSKLYRHKRYAIVLGIGSATGHEFQPIIDKIDDLYILEPSSELQKNKISNKINYIAPNESGTIPFSDESFDLITCFGVLHHIPNVTLVLKEIFRVLKKEGKFLLREPIISMGDWREKRPGLTKNERGISVSYWKKTLSKLEFKIVSQQYCFTATSFLTKLTKKTLSRPIIYYKMYVYLDYFISSILKYRVKYHTTSRLSRIFPQSIFFVLEKNR